MEWWIYARKRGYETNQPEINSKTAPGTGKFK